MPNFVFVLEEVLSKVRHFKVWSQENISQEVQNEDIVDVYWFVIASLQISLRLVYSSILLDAAFSSSTAVPEIVEVEVDTREVCRMTSLLRGPRYN